jgi:DNA-binding NarL/FixJ family response regulator
MQQPQILAYGAEGNLAAMLQELAQLQRLWLRSVAHLRTCRNLLRSARPGALLLRLGRDVERELALLAQVHDDFPETASIVLGDADNPALAGLAWDLGAHHVHFPPAPLPLLRDVILTIFADRSA